MIALLILPGWCTGDWFCIAFLGAPFVAAIGVPGYIGPGAGLSMLPALFAVACVVLLALLGPILYPIYLFRVWRRARRERSSSRSVKPQGQDTAPAGAG